MRKMKIALVSFLISLATEICKAKALWPNPATGDTSPTWLFIVVMGAAIAVGIGVITIGIMGKKNQKKP